jgi:hypothetical protein
VVARGRVQNGVVVLADGIRLPEGQEVTVLASGHVLEDRTTHCILHIPSVSLGAALRPVTSDDDLLGEMPEGRSWSMDPILSGRLSRRDPVASVAIVSDHDPA